MLLVLRHVIIDMSWQPFCAAQVWGGPSCHRNPSIKLIQPPSMELWHILTVYFACLCDLDLDTFCEHVRSPPGFFCSRSDSVELIALKSHHTSSVSLHYLVKCQCLKSNIWNNTTSVTTHFKSASSSSKTDTWNIWCKNCRMHSYCR